MTPSERRRGADRWESEYRVSRRAAADAANRAADAAGESAAALSARDVLQRAAEAVMTEAHGQIAGAVNHALRAVFGADAPGFTLAFANRRGKTEADLGFADAAGNAWCPRTAAAGGELDVAALGVRLPCLMLATPRVRMLLVMDEPLRHLSAEYRDNARNLLETTAADLGVQIIMVTHAPELAAGRVVRIQDTSRE